MVDILKITSPISTKSKVQNLPSKLPSDAVFDITNPNQIFKELPKTKGVDEESGKQSLLKNLNKEIFEPLLHSTRAQADGVRKLVLMAKFFETPSGILSESFLDRVFVKPQEMLGELLTREKGATIFAGEFFDSLRLLAKMEGQPRLKEAIVSILKYFDCYVNQENSLKAIVKQSQDLIHKLPKTGQTIQEQVEILDTMVKLNTKARQNVLAGNQIVLQDDGILQSRSMQQDEGALQSKIMQQDDGDAQGKPLQADTLNRKPVLDLNGIMKRDNESQAEIKTYLKNEIIPELGKIVKRHQGSEKIYNQVMAIVHNIVRYDKADPRLLEDAIFRLGDTLKPLTNLTDEDIIEMKKLVFENAIEEQTRGDRQSTEKRAMEKYGFGQEESDMAALLSRAMDKSGSSKINSVAQTLLMNLVQSESPMLPLMHFTIPFRFMDENTYGEFFVDKDCKERKGDANTAKNIFFTIQSDKYGNFEVDLLAKDKRIDLDIRCPDVLLNSVRETRSKWKEIIEEQGYRLANYQVGVYQESQSIVQRFPRLALRKVGIDVKV